jgi:hypothetical protein
MRSQAISISNGIQFTSGLTRRDCQRVEELVEREAKK